ncbi:MAG: DNA primase [Calditrichaeota bacterium]|nr:MAG: DNA primase [Calditrichota bacterium]
MKIPEQKIDDIRLGNEIVDVVSEYVMLKKKGKNFWGNCPFHQEKTPSFSVNPEKQIFHCFGCHVGGNVFTFIMQHEKIGFVDSVLLLADRAGIDVPKSNVNFEPDSETEVLYRANQMAGEFFINNLKNLPNPAFDYIKSREIDPKFIEKFGLGYSPDKWDGFLNFSKINPEKLENSGLAIKSERGSFYDRFRGRLMFPIYNLSSRIIGFTARQLTDDKNSPKYINTPETDIYNKRSVLYGLNFAKESIRSKDNVYLVEGNMDFVRLFSEGIENTVAGSGTALTENQVQLLSRFTKNVTIVYDGDSAGSKATIRGAEVLVSQGFDVKVMTMPEGEDPDSYVRTKGTDAFYLLEAKSLSLIDFLIASFKNAGFFENERKKFEAVKYILEVVTKIPEHTTRNFFLNSIAQKMEVDENDLRKDYQNILAGVFRYQKKSEPKPVGKNLVLGTLVPIERNIAFAMLLSTDAVKFVSKNLDELELEDKISNTIIHKILDHYDDFGEVNFEKLISQVQDAEAAAFITEAANTQLDEDTNALKTVEDTITKIRKKHLQDSLTKLIVQQKNIPMSDFTAQIELQKEIMEVQKTLKDF